MRNRPKIIVEIAVAAVAVLLSWGARAALSPLLGDRVPFITFFPMVFAVAWWGGLRPALWATLLSVLVLVYFVLAPIYSFSIAQPEYRYGLGIFVAVALAAGWMGERLHAARWATQQATNDAVAEHERLRVTLASIGDAVIVTDPADQVVSLNQVAESLTGWTTEQARGKPLQQVFRIVNEETRREAEDPCATVLRTGTIVGLANHTVLLSKDGSERPIDDSAAPIKDSGGEICGAVVVFRDVTDRKQDGDALSFFAKASATLAALADRQSVLEQSARIAVPYLADWCVVYVIDEKGGIDYHAHAHRDPAKEHLLTKMLTHSPLDWNSNTATVRALRTGQSQLMTELPAPFLDSIAQSEEHREIIRELGPRAVISVPLRIRDRVIGVMGLVNCDPARQYTARDVHLSENLAERVATAVDNSRLFHAVKEAVRQKDEFLAMLAHELRNPLAAIRYAVALGHMSNGDSPSELFGIIDRQTQNLAHLIDDLLDVSRISRNKVTLRKEQIEVATIVNRAAATVRSLMEQKKHELVLDLPDDPLLLHADPTRAEQIVLNLLTNAGKYTKEGGRVTVRARRDNQDVLIEVIDSGVGLPPEMIGRVFDLFAQADRTLDRSEGGLGIGLTVARKLAEMHGGSISAASEGLGHGATFTVRLPLSKVPASHGEPDAPAAQASNDEKWRILVVDDNQDTANSCAMLLKNLGHETATAYDGPAALESARSFRPQVLFLDIGLPGLNGYDVARTLRDEGFQNETFVAISGYGQPDDRRRSQEAGFDDHLVKPVDQAAILSTLRNVRDKQPA